MFVEQIAKQTFGNIIEYYPSIAYFKNLFIGENLSQLLIYTNYIDHSYTFKKILEEKYGENAKLRKAKYKENPYLYNNFCYIIDVKEWNIPNLKEFVIEFSCLKNVSMIPNLFVIFNFEEMDRETQSTIGICIDTNVNTSRFWLLVNNLNNVSQKVKNRTFLINIKRPTNEHMKLICKKIIREKIDNYSSVPPFLIHLDKYDILLDKLIENSDNDYGKLFLNMDIIKYNPNILNYQPFSLEKENIKQFFINKDYLIKNYPKLREICFNLIEKYDLVFIIKEIYDYLKDIFNQQQKCSILTIIADYQSKNLIPNKQVWILETWLLESIDIYFNEL